MTITYSRLTAELDRRHGLPPHSPVWSAVDCPSCGSAPCGPHPDVLVCADCDEDWPCPPVQLVVEELFERAQELWNLAGTTESPDEASGYHHATRVLRDRARYLEGT